MPRPKVVLLMEDCQHCCFAKAFLVEHGIHKRRIKEVPVGSRSTVLETYPNEIKALRAYGNSHALIVIADSDRDSPAVVRQLLKQKLAKEGMAPVSSSERVLVISPKWSIETWIWFLRGKSVTEVKKLKKLKRVDESRDDARALAQVCQGTKKLPGDPPPSLADACSEWAGFKSRVPK